MRNYFTTVLIVFGMSISLGQEKDAPEFAGENFSLEGALTMLKKASTIEEFEQLINDERNDINNLDLNNDGNIDYITVEDVIEKNSHVLVLTALVGENEKQDIATIAIEKTGNEEARLQIFGDEDLYAEMGAEKGPAMPEIISNRIVVNVWTWPSVRFVFAPGYQVWISPIRWAAYPRWWKPWRPIRHSLFIGRCHVHKVYFHRTSTRHVVVHKSYKTRRHTSTTVVKSKRGTTVIHKGRAGKVRAVHTRRR
jgi:hypothetical protein